MKQYPDVIRVDLYKSKELQRIQNELSKQYDKWGMQKRTLFEWMCYLTEEVGELAEAVSEQEYRKGLMEDIRKEATQVAALAIKFLQVTEGY